MYSSFSGFTRLLIINFLIYQNSVNLFNKLLHAKDVECKDADYYFKFMEKVAKEIGPGKVIQVVTNTAVAMKLQGQN